MDLASFLDVTGSPFFHLVGILDGESDHVVSVLVLVFVVGVVITLQPAWSIGEWGVGAWNINVADG